MSYDMVINTIVYIIFMFEHPLHTWGVASLSHLNERYRDANQNLSSKNCAIKGPSVGWKNNYPGLRLSSYFLGIKLFCFLRYIYSSNFQHLFNFWFGENSQNFSSFRQLLFFVAHVTNGIEIQLLTWGVTNRDVLLLATYGRLKKEWNCLVFI